jgi:hypothetical protein
MNHSESRDAVLARTLKALAEIEAAAETPSRVEQAVMAQWDTRRRTAEVSLPRRSAAKAGVVRVTTVAAGVTLIAAAAWDWRSATVPDTTPVPAREVQSPAASDALYTTMPVVGGPLGRNEPVRVVRVRVPRSAVSELGIPTAPQADTVEIDVLVGEDGVARGVRMAM